VTSDVVCHLSSVKRTDNPFFESKIAHANNTLNRSLNHLDVLDSDITHIFGQR